MPKFMPSLLSVAVFISIAINGCVVFAEEKENESTSSLNTVIKELAEKYKTDTVKILDNAAEKTKTSREVIQADGDLDGILETKKIQEQIENGKQLFVEKGTFPNIDTELSKNVKLKTILAELQKNLQELKFSYKSALLKVYKTAVDEGNEKVKQLTKDDKIEDAVKLRNELKPMKETYEALQKQDNKTDAEPQTNNLFSKKDEDFFEKDLKAGTRKIVKFKSEDTEISAYIAFHWIPEGTFTMGDGTNAREAVISNGFFMAETETTQLQWIAVMGENPSRFQKNKNQPVEQVSWDEVHKFIKKLNEQNAAPENYQFALPTEVQWEYACRAGSTTAYCCGNDDKVLKDYAWYGEEWNGGSPHPVAQKKANAWGLYDMHGNVFEWCEDVLDADIPAVWIKRGGTWHDSIRYCRSATRATSTASCHNLGFRVILIDKKIKENKSDPLAPRDF